ncbi:MAG: LamB/YcsF family protein [Ignavibacteria bacterium]|nr:LamB/YcsF family protein [Ignavibacteria bacterium]
MKKIIDINSDLGERPEALANGSEEELIWHISSANIACGGHAGDAQTMMKAIELCAKYGVAIGAHPGYPDRENFGRVEMNLSAQEIELSVLAQVRTLVDLAQSVSCTVRHVKPHGALYNSAASNPATARAIARAVCGVDKSLILIGLAGSRMLEVWKNQGCHAAAEAFADRRYEPDGSLRSRAFADALITDPADAALQAVQIARDGYAVAADGARVPIDARTLSIHSDTPNAIAIAGAVRDRLLREGVKIAPP